MDTAKPFILQKRMWRASELGSPREKPQFRIKSLPSLLLSVVTPASLDGGHSCLSLYPIIPLGRILQDLFADSLCRRLSLKKLEPW